MNIGIIFDLDGTLLNTLGDLTDATNHILACHGFPQRTEDEVRQFVGNGSRVLIERATGGRADTDALLDEYKEYYESHCRIRTAPYVGIPEMLAVLQQKYPLAIVSNKPDGAVRELCGEYFPGIFARGEDRDCPRKPAPDMVRKAMEAIGIDTCIYVGDSEVDVATAKNAGVRCLSVLWGFRDRETIEMAGGTDFCTSPTELPAIIGRILEEIHG